MMRYYSFHQAMHDRFGCKVYKLSLNAGLGCPNRDGTVGSRGCTFCSRLGSGDFAPPADMPIARQLEAAKARVARKNPGGRYIAYFQSYTNTYAPPEVLRTLYTEAIAPPDIVGLDVATRPDCLGPEVLEVLAKLAAKKPLWVELGLQTVHESTARAIRRGWDTPLLDTAIESLHAVGAEVILHQIIGLPGETPEMMQDTARYIARSGAEGVKLHLLHILDDADLYADFLAGRVRVLEMEEYFSILSDCLRVLPPDMVIHRLTGDGAKRHLIAPMWSADKKRVLNAMARYFEEHDVIQGSKYLSNKNT